MIDRLLNPPKIKPPTNVIVPYAFTAEPTPGHVEEVSTLTSQKVWQVAMAPARSIPMNLIMSYFAGNSLQIIPIMTTVNLIYGPLKSIFTFKSQFPKVEVPPSAYGVFIFWQLVLVAIGVYKLNSMGLLPTTTSDWLAWETQ